MLRNADILLHIVRIVSVTQRTMSITEIATSKALTQEEWEELIALKNAINDSLSSVHYDKMERFSELMVRSLQERGG